MAADQGGAALPAGPRWTGHLPGWRGWSWLQVLLPTLRGCKKRKRRVSGASKHFSQAPPVQASSRASREVSNMHWDHFPLLLFHRCTQPVWDIWGYPYSLYVCVSCSAMSHSLGPHGLRPVKLHFHRILQARILERVVIPFSRGSSWPRDQTQVSHIEGRFFTVCASREALFTFTKYFFMSVASTETHTTILSWLVVSHPYNRWKTKAQGSYVIPMRPQRPAAKDLKICLTLRHGSKSTSSFCYSRRYLSVPLFNSCITQISIIKSAKDYQLETTVWS